MAIGYEPGPFVWAIDRNAHRVGPVHRDLVALYPERYEPDEQHPVVDERGVLLPSKPLNEAWGDPQGTPYPDPFTNDPADTPQED